MTPSSGRRSAPERILRAAIALFKARGYHGTSVRDLAQAVKVEAASLYYHFPSKQAILFEFFHRIMDAMLAGFERVLQSEATPAAQLQAMVRMHVEFHIVRRDEAFISHSELRSLTPQNRRKIVAQRDRYEGMLRAILEAGVREGSFEIIDVPVTSTAILVMCSGVSDWFIRRGRLTPDIVADSYAELVARMVGLRTGSPGPDKPLSMQCDLKRATRKSAKASLSAQEGRPSNRGE